MAVPFDILLGPGELAALLALKNIQPAADSPLVRSGLLDQPAGDPAVAIVGIPEDALNTALIAITQTACMIEGRRGARRNEPWPFFVYTHRGSTVILAPEAGGAVRLRFPYTDTEALEWLTKPFHAFVLPEIPLTVMPALKQTGIAVLLTLVDLFRARYPNLDPDLKYIVPVTFTIDEVVMELRLGVEGDDPSSLLLGWMRLEKRELSMLSPDDISGLIYLFANEGLLNAELVDGEMVFTMTETFVWTAMCMAWWDLSLLVAVASGIQSVSVIQGIALWRFVTDTDERLRIEAISGTALRQEIASLFAGKPGVPALAPEKPAAAVPSAPAPTTCVKCHEPYAPGARFCIKCGTPMATTPASSTVLTAAIIIFCRQCGSHLDSEARFCTACGKPVA
ncbi:MAG: zinc ribbon domain-containing protein [Pseudomonadota bacterium]